MNLKETQSSYVVPASALKAAISQLLRRLQVPDQHAHYVAETLVTTSLLGVDTHGVELLPVYIKELEGGRSIADPKLEISSIYPALLSLNANSALGIVAGNVAVRMAIAKAAEYGIAAVAVSNSNHFGAAGYYSKLAAEQDKLCFVFSNSDALVAPYNGHNALNGTNPLAITASGVTPNWFHLDMATSQISYSQAKRRHDSAQENNGHWAVVNDAHNQARIILQPLGGYKGQGLGMMVQILCAILTKMPLDSELSHLFDAPFSIGRQVGHFFICIDIGGFIPPTDFKQRLSRLIDLFHTGEPDVLIPGDIEAQSYAKRSADGISISQHLYQSLLPFLS
jgi:LDH2 family malate/lactate/ureidoglycolate dehydrogenase